MATCNVCGKDAGYLYSVCERCRSTTPENATRAISSPRDTVRSGDPSKQHGLIFWISVVVGSVVVLFVGSAIIAGIFGSSRTHFPPGVTGIQHIDSGTDYVFKDEPTLIGGACTGWKTVSIGPRGHSANAITNLMCWKDVDGMLHVATEKEESTIVQPMTDITRPD